MIRQTFCPWRRWFVSCAGSIGWLALFGILKLSDIYHIFYLTISGHLTVLSSFWYWRANNIWIEYWKIQTSVFLESSPIVFCLFYLIYHLKAISKSTFKKQCLQACGQRDINRESVECTVQSTGKINLEKKNLGKFTYLSPLLIWIVNYRLIPYLQETLPSFQKLGACSSDRYLLDHRRAQRGQILLPFVSTLAYKHWKTDLTKQNTTQIFARCIMLIEYFY